MARDSEGVFLNPKNDLAFRKIFAQPKHAGILINFLNTFLRLEGDRLIKEVTLLDPINIPELQGLKETIVDVRCVDQRGTHYVIEMQVWTDKHFFKRMLYYACHNYIRQLNSGEQYPTLNQVICIALLDFDYLPGDRYLSEHLILDKETHQHHLKDFMFVFAELRKFNKTVDELTTPLDEWLFFFRHATQLRDTPKQLHTPQVQEALETLHRYHWSKTELDNYEKAALARGAYRSQLNTAHDEGMEKGVKEGIEKGKEEGEKVGLEKGRLAEKHQIVQQMLTTGCNLDLIVKVTGLSEQEIKKLQ